MGNSVWATRLRVSLCASLLLLLILAGLSSTSAVTVGELMQENCPSADAVDQRAIKAAMLADDGSYALFKEAAGLYYDCFQRLSDSYTKDVAHVFYLSDLFSSANPRDDTSQLISLLITVKSGADDLSRNTAYPDVRKRAQQLSKNAQSALSGLSSLPH